MKAKPRLHRDYWLEKLYPRLHRRRHSETVPRHFRLDRGVLADHCLLTVAVGMVLACLVQWEALRGKAVYRVLLILPYAVPSFISILIFKGLFNQSFGEINMMLSALFGVKPARFSDPTTARTMLIIVNTAGLSVHDDPLHGLAESDSGRFV